MLIIVYYYPPPAILLVLKNWTIAKLLIIFSLLIYGAILAKGWLLLIWRASLLMIGNRHPGCATSTYAPGVRVYVDCSARLPRKYLVMSAILINPSYCWQFFSNCRWDQALYTALETLRLDLHLWTFLWYFWFNTQVAIYIMYYKYMSTTRYITDGVRIFKVRPRKWKDRLREILHVFKETVKSNLKPSTMATKCKRTWRRSNRLLPPLIDPSWTGDSCMCGG